MSCQCHQIGGPFIAEDPDCEVHRSGGLGDQIDALRDEVSDLRYQLERLQERFEMRCPS